MIKATSQIIDNENCKLEMEVDGSIKNLELEAVIIIENLINQIAKCNRVDERELLAHFFVKLSEQFEGVEYEVNRYRRK